MRQMEEYKAEIFRRSEYKIRERKKKRLQTILWCTPFFLCTFLWAVLILPAMMPAGSEDSSYDEMKDEMEIQVEENIEISCVSLEILDENGVLSHRITEQALVSDLFRTVRSYTAKEDVSDDRLEAETDPSSSDQMEMFGKANRSLIFTDTNGSAHLFSLSGNTITDKATGEKAELTGEELTQLETYLQPTNGDGVNP